MTSCGSPSSTMMRPSTLRSPPKRRCQKSCESTATLRAARSSSTVNVRPISGGTAMTCQNSGVTSLAVSFSAPSLPVSVAAEPLKAPTASKTSVVCSCQSNSAGRAIGQSVHEPWTRTIRRIRSDSGYGSGLSSTALTTENTVPIAPSASASVTIATNAKPGVRARLRKGRRIALVMARFPPLGGLTPPWRHPGGSRDPVPSGEESLDPDLRRDDAAVSARMRAQTAASLVPERFHRRGPRGAPRRQPAREQRDRAEHDDDDGERRGIAALHAEQLRLHEARQHERSDDADAEAERGDLAALLEHELRDVAALRADREPHAELARALLDREREHAVDADRGKQQRDAGEDREQDHRRLAPVERDLDPLVERADVEHRLLGIDAQDRVADRLREPARRELGLDDEETVLDRELPEREVEALLLDLLGEREGLHRADDADDRPDPRRAVLELRPLDALADRRVVREILLREVLVDDDDIGRALRVGRREAAALQHRDLERGEIVLVDRAAEAVRTRDARHVFPSFDVERGRPGAAAERQVARVGDC